MPARRISRLGLLALLLTLPAMSATPRAVFVVNHAGNAGDGDVGDGVCDTGTPAAPTGLCTLRAAIEQANQTPGVDIIDFAIGTGVVRIVSFGDVVTDPVIIDGTTQPGYAGVPLIEVDGDMSAGTGFWLTAGNSIIRGLSITGFTGYGVRISSSSNVLERNYIGVEPDGVTADGNGASGVYIDGLGTSATDNDVGLGAQGFGNVISGNTDDGVLISGSQASGNRVRGNLIGVNADGTAPISNTDHGVNVFNGATGNQIGGVSTDPGLCLDDCNVISGNGRDGVILASDGNTVLGNHIGTGTSVSIPIGNGDDGVSFVNSDFNLVGGSDPDTDVNIIAYNGDEGIFSSSPQQNEILFNDIYDNGGLGIDLGLTGPTGNDAGEADGIANHPIITSAAGTIDGTLSTFPNTLTTVYFYASAQCDPSGFGEGARVLGSVTDNTDGNGDLAFSWPAPQGVAAGEVITATQSSVTQGPSEFSACTTYSVPPPQPLTVNAADDVDDGVCDGAHCSLREAIDEANVDPGPDEIEFDLPGPAPYVIALASALPDVTDELTIDGSSQPGYVDRPVVELDGSSAGAVDGIVLRAPVRLDAIALTSFDGNGVYIAGPEADGTIITGTHVGLAASTEPLPLRLTSDIGIPSWELSGSGILSSGARFKLAEGISPLPRDRVWISGGRTGVSALGTAAGFLMGVQINGTSQAAIDLGDDGPTPNDPDDADTGPNGFFNLPTLTSSTVGSTIIEGTYDGLASTKLYLQFYANSACHASGFGEAQEVLGVDSITTDANGDATFVTTFSRSLTPGDLISATATDSSGVTSELSGCVAVADFAVAATPDSIAFSGQSQGTFEISVSSVAGDFNRDVTLSCPDAPSGVSCSFSPATVTPLDGEVTSTLTVSVSSPALTAGTARPGIGGGGGGSSPGLSENGWGSSPGLLMTAGLVALVILLLGLLGTAPRLGAEPSRRVRYLRLLLPLIAVVLAVACESDSTAPPSDQPVTYSFSVRGTSGGVTHDAPVSVTVQP